MTSLREQILAELFTRLRVLEAEDVKVCRNLDKPQKIPTGGAIIVLRDGESGEPETLLSPLTYIYEHRATLEILTGTDGPDPSETVLDQLLMAAGDIIAQDRSLDGLVEWVEASAPELLRENAEGTPTIRTSIVTVTMRFHTTDPLH